MKYKDLQNKVHEITDGFQHLMPNWPIGYTEITEEEFNAGQLIIKQIQEAETLGRENYKALIRREADALDAAGEPYKALKHLKTIGE